MENVSVIIPFYSGADWLDEALDSVENQTYPINEIIVVNDGSKENIKDIKEKHLKVKFYDKENGGAASARNYGIKRSNGDVIFFLDSDDIWMQNKVECQINYMNDNGFMWCATAYKSFGSGKSNIVTPYKCEGLCWKHIYNSCRIQTSTVSIRKKILDDIDQPFAEDMRNGQDVYLWFILACRYPLGVIMEPLTLFRIRGTNAHLNYVTHICVRALLWGKITNDIKLMKTKNILTVYGYRLCAMIYKKSNGNIKKSFLNKVLFFSAWASFRIANVF